jgi:hypothetical protein
VPKHLFEAAERVRRFNEKVYVSHDDILKGMRAVLKREGRLSAEIINRAPELPSANTVEMRFGSLGLAYEALGYVPNPRYWFHALQRELTRRCTKLQEELIVLLDAHGVSAWVSRPRILIFGDFSNLEVMICRWQRRHEHDGGWRVSYKRNAGADFIVAVRLSEDAHYVKDYLLVPRHDVGKLPVFLRTSHQTLLARYAYRSVEAVARKLADSLRRQRTGSPSAALRASYNTALRDSR